MVIDAKPVLFLNMEECEHTEHTLNLMDKLENSELFSHLINVLGITEDDFQGAKYVLGALYDYAELEEEKNF